MGLVIIVVIAVGIAFVVGFFVYFTRMIERLEEDNGHLDEVPQGSLKYKVPVGVDPAMVVVNLHHQGYQVTTRYDYGQTYLYIRTVSGSDADREIIRSLILNADEVEYAALAPRSAQGPSEAPSERRAAGRGLAMPERRHRSSRV